MKVSLGIAALGSMLVSHVMTAKSKKTEISELKNRIEVLSDHFQLLNHWLEIRNEGKTVASYFKEMGYRHIAIYGMADLANRLSEELVGTSVSVDYGIDRDVSCSLARIGNVYGPGDDLPETDAVVVTPYASFESIKFMLEKKVTCPIVSLEEVVWSV